jgi:hypothetical protein
MTYYIDGAPAGTDTIGAPVVSSEPLRMGVRLNSNGTISDYRSLVVDDLRIYSRALSAAEISLLATP